MLPLVLEARISSFLFGALASPGAPGALSLRSIGPSMICMFIWFLPMPQLVQDSLSTVDTGELHDIL
jgi:hypothetical protein